MPIDVIHGRKLIDALMAAGIVDDQTQRVIIEVDVRGVPTIYTQKVGGEALSAALVASLTVGPEQEPAE